MNTWHFYLLNWQRVGHVWVIIISFVYTELLVWAFPQSLRFNLAYCLKSSLLLAFCFLLLCIVDQTQMCPSSILPLGLFQGIICNIERLKGWNLEPWIAGGPKLEGGPQTLLHTMLMWYYILFSKFYLPTSSDYSKLARYASNMY